ncbi:MAG: Thymidylate kinase [Candidatus Roizmanbacteria bacterium GW2011_GWA2_34_18]|uniref:Thymidylate kinase n=1 Tax=Candidatus Roizmanbacteria bacterium GW2011_GWA2_34_18 TaxID=1618477 RepID=A0A0G0E1X2_9BACT|nr:MAG: Thymidylate kinase [Candidatus Roizmanbacteria bacterium GW2011_GWA2_34_18]
MRSYMGKLIVIEGTDGSGKGTQLQLLLNYLNKKQISYASFDFPQYGKTFFGDFAGRFLNGEFGHFSRINPYLASFPYAADRWQVKDQLWKAINDKKLVICNRYTPSAVYQAVKVKPTQRKNFLKWAETLEYKVFGIPRPDLVLFLYVPLVFAQILIAKKSKDQYEKDVVYLKKVETMYLEIVKTNKSWVKIDCVENNKILPPEIIHKKILDKLSLS